MLIWHGCMERVKFVLSFLVALTITDLLPTVVAILRSLVTPSLRSDHCARITTAQLSACLCQCFFEAFGHFNFQFDCAHARTNIEMQTVANIIFTGILHLRVFFRKWTHETCTNFNSSDMNSRVRSHTLP